MCYLRTYLFLDSENRHKMRSATIKCHTHTPKEKKIKKHIKICNMFKMYVFLPISE